MKDNEINLVLTSMREAYTKKVSAVDDAHATLIRWGAEIKRQFDIDNLHLVNCAQHDGTAQVAPTTVTFTVTLPLHYRYITVTLPLHHRYITVAPLSTTPCAALYHTAQVIAAVRGLAVTVGRMHTQLSDIGARMVTLETNSNKQSTSVAELITGVNTLSMVRAPEPQAMQREAARPGAPQAPPPPLPVTPHAPPPLVAPLVTPLVAPTPLVMPRNAFAVLTGGPSRGSGVTSTTITTTTGLEANIFFLDCMARGGSAPPLPSQQQSVADLVLKALKAMATPEEKAVLMLKPRAEGHALAIANSVVALLLDYFEFRFLSVGAKVPPGLRRGTTLVSKLKDHIKSLSIDISPTAFAAWRKAGCRKRPAPESEGAEESEAAEEPGAVRASPGSLGSPGQEAGSSDDSSEEGDRPRRSPVQIDLT